MVMTIIYTLVAIIAVCGLIGGIIFGWLKFSPAVMVLLFVLIVIGWFKLADNLNRYEIANGYPYGKLCDVYNNCAKEK